MCEQRLWSHCHPFRSPPLPPQKVNANFYLNKVLKLLSEKDIPRLFGKDANSAMLHHDSARAHAAAATAQWLENFGYNLIPARNWPTDSPDLSPMDYSLNEIFKRRLWKQKARRVKGTETGYAPRMVRNICWSLC